MLILRSSAEVCTAPNLCAVCTARLNSKDAHFHHASNNNKATGKNAMAAIPKPNKEFQLYTKPDCADTPFENNNRTWFFFSIAGMFNS